MLRKESREIRDKKPSMGLWTEMAESGQDRQLKGEDGKTSEVNL